jgi:hypothetical protein
MPHVQYTVVHLHIARGLIINMCEASVRMLTDAAAAFFLLGRGLLEIQGHFAKVLHCDLVGFDTIQAAGQLPMYCFMVLLL